jgi:hypothetical protein
MSEIRDYQVDHLLLLVGSNPVPNAVAGKLLTSPGGTISLIHSADGLDLAQRLKSWFLDAGYSDTNIGFTQVEESNATLVYERVHEVLEQRENDFSNAKKARIARVGLNYTGGTKVMSVHAYRALENWAKSRDREAFFSYLDARTLQMRFDRAPGRDAISFSVGQEVDIGIGDLLELHDWKLEKNPTSEPVLPQSAATLLAVHSNPTDAKIWTDWRQNELFRNARRREVIPPPIWVYQSEEELQEKLERPASNDRWKSNTDLRKLAISWPNLPALRETMSNELGQGDAEYLNLTAAKGKRCKDEVDFCKWLSGTWLESAMLTALQNCPQELHLKECRMDLQPKVPRNGAGKTGFQFDVVAIRGYQLFAFSCTTESAEESGGRGLLKQKLFEAYVRARQMGGDEACVALVCCMRQEEADKLEDEMRRDISPEGRIRVFGREHLEKLTENIADWVRQQSKEC